MVMLRRWREMASACPFNGDALTGERITDGKRTSLRHQEGRAGTAAQGLPGRESWEGKLRQGLITGFVKPSTKRTLLHFVH